MLAGSNGEITRTRSGGTTLTGRAGGCVGNHILTSKGQRAMGRRIAAAFSWDSQQASQGQGGQGGQGRRRTPPVIKAELEPCTPGCYRRRRGEMVPRGAPGRRREPDTGAAGRQCGRGRRRIPLGRPLRSARAAQEGAEGPEADGRGGPAHSWSLQPAARSHLRGAQLGIGHLMQAARSLQRLQRPAAQPRACCMHAALPLQLPQRAGGHVAGRERHNAAPRLCDAGAGLSARKTRTGTSTQASAAPMLAPCCRACAARDVPVRFSACDVRWAGLSVRNTASAPVSHPALRFARPLGALPPTGVCGPLARLLAPRPS